MKKNIKNPKIVVTLEKNDIALIGRNSEDAPIIFVDGNTRDVIVSANTFLVMLNDQTQDSETKIRIRRVMNYLSDMLYGFDAE